MKALPSGRQSCPECGWRTSHWTTYELEPGGRYGRTLRVSCQNTKEWCGEICNWIDGIPKKETATGFMLMKRKIRWNWLAKIN